MPIFTQNLRRLNYANVPEAIKAMANHIQYIQEQLEWTLMNLDSSNISEIDTTQTTIGSSTTGSSITGDNLTFKGKNGEIFTAGISETGSFVFTVKGKGGAQMMYLTEEGELVISANAALNIDGGEW